MREFRNFIKILIKTNIRYNNEKMSLSIKLANVSWLNSYLCVWFIPTIVSGKRGERKKNIFHYDAKILNWMLKQNRH